MAVKTKSSPTIKFVTGAEWWNSVQGTRYFIDPETGDILKLDKRKKDIHIRASEGPHQGEFLYQCGDKPTQFRTRRDTVALMIVRYDEEVGAALVEARIRNLRQAYAALVIAFGISMGEAYPVEGVNVQTVNDLELLLPKEQRLVIVGAGVGSFVLLLKKAGEVAAKAPEKTMAALSLFFGWGQDLFKQRMEAVTKIKTAEKDAAVLKNEMTRIEVDKAKQLSKIDIERAQREEKEAAEKAEREKRDFEYNLAKKQANDYLDLIKKFGEIPSDVLREKTLEGFDTNMRQLLPPSVIKELPPAPSPGA